MPMSTNVIPEPEELWKFELETPCCATPVLRHGAVDGICCCGPPIDCDCSTPPLQPSHVPGGMGTVPSGASV